MTHDIPSEGRPSAVTGQPETPVASRVDERACSRPAAAAPGAAEGISAAPGISPADHPLGVETPEQAARYWQMRHAEAAIEIAQAKHRNLKLQAELAAVSKRHVDAAIETQQDLKSLTAARAEVERLKAALAEEKRLHAAAEEARRCAIATLAGCHELVDQAAIPGLERDRMQSLQVRISGLIERATKPVHVAPPPADTASCEQHLQERIEELEAELKAARADLSGARRYCEGIETERIAHLRTINDVHAMLDRLNIGRVGVCTPRSLSERVYSLHERSQHPAMDSIHAALDRAGVPRDEVDEVAPRIRPKTPQSRIAHLAADRDAQKDLFDRASKDVELLNWLDRVGDLVVLDLRVGPVCVKRGATGAHKTLRDALEAIRISELDDLCRRVVRKEAVK